MTARTHLLGSAAPGHARHFKLTDFYGTTIYTLDRGRVTRPDVGVAGLVNPMEFEKIAQRTHRRQELNVVKEGKSAGGLSYGYRVPKYLLSPFLACGCCGGKMTNAGSGKTYYYCANEKAKGTPGLVQTEGERFVLGGLKTHLMKDEACQTFRRKVKAQMNARAERVNAGLRPIQDQIRTREKEAANLVKAIAQGNLSKGVTASLATAEADLETLQATRATETPQAISLPEDLPSVYRAYVTDLTAALAQDIVVARASDALRALARPPAREGFRASDPEAGTLHLVPRRRGGARVRREDALLVRELASRGAPPPIVTP